MTTPVLTYAFQPVRVVDADSRWPQATVVYFMVLAAEDAYKYLSALCSYRALDSFRPPRAETSVAIL